MFCEKLIALRKKHNLTQETMARIFEVSRQAVQKWEGGTALPDIDRLIRISKYFNVSIDYLILNHQETDVHPMRMNYEVIPMYDKMHEWELYSSALEIEYRQCIEEGKDIQNLKNLFTQISLLKQSEHKEKMADILFNMINEAGVNEDYEYSEPSDLESIQKLTYKELPELYCDNVSESKIRGAWVGRICGCLLGKTVECIHRDELHQFLKATNNFPMHRYIEAKDAENEICKSLTFSFEYRVFADNITSAPIDDDTNYTVMSSKIIDMHGRDFTPEHVANAWIDLQSKNAYCTAERVAFKNFINGFYPPSSATYKNPYREWIGAQIRTDYYGYINPGDTKTAAEMAWRDASISHVKNGIYGAMFVSAALAAAAVVKDIRSVILYGLSEIPSTSRFYKRISDIVDCYDNKMPMETWFKDFHARYNDKDGHDWCHTISNAEIVVSCLLYGEGDFGKSIYMAVENAFDTDCNGATVGSILGMMNGIESIDEYFIKPLHNTLDTSIHGVGKVSIDEMVQKTIEHIKMKK